jgi:hypothetical protein
LTDWALHLISQITGGGAALKAMIAHTLTTGQFLALWLYAPQHGFTHYLRTHYADKTFEHLYHANSFDTALLIPYFFVMIVLSFYGIHRYQLVYRYY